MTQAAFFDLDKTVIAKAAMLALGPRLHQEGLLNRWMVGRALWGQLVFRYLGADEGRMQKMRETALRAASGWEKERISQLVEEALTEVIDPLVYAEALELIESHQEQGHRVYLVSASPEEIVMPLARHVGVDAAIATRARVDPSGRYTGEVEFYAAGEGKVEAITAEAGRFGLDLANSYAYSDSVTDIPMLELVGNPVAVNPDRGLLKLAQERDWEIRVFDSPKPLMEARTVPAPSVSVLAAAGGVAAAGAWLWRSRRGRGVRR